MFLKNMRNSAKKCEKCEDKQKNTDQSEKMPRNRGTGDKNQ